MDKCKECDFIDEDDKQVCLLDFNYGECPLWLKKAIYKAIDKEINYHE
jgi:hypothetical protein